MKHGYMSETWLQAYILLAFRIHKVVQVTYGDECLFVESYYGPQAWREQAESEPQITPADLVRQAAALFDAIPAQGFPANREIYLAKHVRAIKMLTRSSCCACARPARCSKASGTTQPSC